MSVKAIGRGYPVPKGACDIYSYDVKGIAQNISLDIMDNRSTQQRLTDRFDNAGRMLMQGIGDGYRRATEYNPALNKLGNAAKLIMVRQTSLKMSSVQQARLSEQAMLYKV